MAPDPLLHSQHMHAHRTRCQIHTNDIHSLSRKTSATRESIPPSAVMTDMPAGAGKTSENLYAASNLDSHFDL